MPRTNFLLAAALLLSAVARSEPILITGATVHTLGPNGTVRADLLVAEGRIVAIGADSAQSPAARRVAYDGKHLYPGYVLANSVLGLTEIEAARATQDSAEIGPVNPNARTWVAVNPDSELIPVARANGIVAVHVVPQASDQGLLTGSSAVLRLAGWTWEQMLVEAPVGVHLSWPTSRLPPWLPRTMLEEARKTVEQRKQALTKAFQDLRRYQAGKQGGTLEAADLRWEALLPVLEGRQRLFIHADDLGSIREALEFARGEGVRWVLVGGRDAWRIAAELKQDGVPVILGAPYELPARRSEPYDVVYRNAERLRSAGLEFAIAGEGSAFAAALERNLPYQAAVAVAHGLPPEEGLKAITLYPARILGVADRLGSLEVGKEASFLVTDGDPLEITTTVEMVGTRGREVGTESRHTRLYRRYLERSSSAP
jgi:imidazolonepropionase-like amidohydrolase